MSGYLSVDGKARHEIVIERSRFITTAAYVESSAQARAVIADIRKEYSGATHNCYAYIIGGEQKSSDDGEPQGTAGAPIMEVLKRRNLNFTLIVVTRYFGGVKLGAAGLVSAYTRAAAETLDKSQFVEHINSAVFRVELKYGDYQKAQKAIADFGEIIDSEFNDTVNLRLAVPTENADKIVHSINELSSGSAKIENLETKYYTYKR